LKTNLSNPNPVKKCGATCMGLWTGKASLCVYLVFRLFGGLWLFSTVDVAFFTCDNLATLLCRLLYSMHRQTAQLHCST